MNLGAALLVWLSAILLQGGFPIIFLPLLGILLLVFIPAIVIIFRRASRRNPKRPDDEQADEGEVGEKARRNALHFVGLMLAASGLLMALVGMLCALTPDLVGNVVPITSLGIFMGLVGYLMRSRKLGRSAVVIATVALFIGVAASQGIIPGLEPTDRNLPSVQPNDSQQD